MGSEASAIFRRGSFAEGGRQADTTRSQVPSTGVHMKAS